MSEAARVTLGKAATSVVRHVSNKIVEEGLKSLPQFRQCLGRLEATNASDVSTIALVLMVAGCEALGIDPMAIDGLKLAPRDGEEKGKAEEKAADDGQKSE